VATYSGGNESHNESYSLDEKPHQRNCSPAECLFDKEKTKIYIKKYKTGNAKSKHGRVYDKVYACLYCHKLVTNITIHMETKHANEPEVKEIKQLKNKRKGCKNKELNKTNLLF